MPLASEDRAEISSIFSDMFEPLIRALLGNRVITPNIEPEPVSSEEHDRIIKVIAPAMFGDIPPYPVESDEFRSRTVETLRRRKGYQIFGRELRFHNDKHQLVLVNIEKVREFARKMDASTPRRERPTGPAARNQDQPQPQTQPQQRSA